MMVRPAETTGAAAFEELVSALDYPMFVVTTGINSPPVRAGCLVGFCSQTGIHPPRFLVGLSKRNGTIRVARHAGHLAVHVLTRDHLELARLFGSQTGDKTDKFGLCAWRVGPAGMPILQDAAAWFVGAVLDRFEVGDHVGYLLDPVAGSCPDHLDNLVSFADVRDLTPGHEP